MRQWWLNQFFFNFVDIELQTTARSGGIIMIEKIFSNLSKWRNLPNYQLERRADIFFSLYINDIVSNKIGIYDEWVIIPEFPIAIKVIRPTNRYNNSFKIDYLVVGRKTNRVIFIELKTDNSSRRVDQDLYLEEAANIGLYNLLVGLKDVFIATSSKKKYLYLFLELRDIGLVNFDSTLVSLLRKNQQGIGKAIRNIEICDNRLTRAKPEILYIQPSGSGTNIVNFIDIAEIIQKKYEDRLSLSFVNALKEWEAKVAGEF